MRCRTIMLLLGGAAAAVTVRAQPTVYRCLNDAGRTAYQSTPCADGRQTEVNLPVQPPAQPQAQRPSAWKGYTPPKSAVITFYYDPKDEPVGFTTAQMEGMIRSALAAWMAGCKVELVYGGRAARKPAGAHHVSIHWVAEFMYVAHPADGRSGIAGVGSLAYGIGLRPRFSESHMLSTLVHEVGHVLGLPHNHEDTRSVMSYLRDETSRRNPQPAESDLVACNLSMKKMFDIDYTPPADAALPKTESRMSDKEALDRMRAPPSR